jgi:hypothetical protein
MAPDGAPLSGIETYDGDRSTDPYLVSLVNAAREGRAARQSENIKVVSDELAATAVRRRTILLKKED